MEIDFAFITPAIAGSASVQAPRSGEMTSLGMRASGELYLKCYEIDAGRWQVAAMIGNLAYRIEGETPLHEFPSEGNVSPNGTHCPIPRQNGQMINCPE